MIDQQIGHYAISSKLGAGGWARCICARDTQAGSPCRAEGAAGRSRLRNRIVLPGSSAKPSCSPLSITPPSPRCMDSRRLAVAISWSWSCVEGKTLAERIARGPIPVEEALRIALQIAEALEAAHAKGRHPPRSQAGERRRSPPTARSRSLDFGLAKALDAPAGRSRHPELADPER